MFGLLEGVFLEGVIDELHYGERGELVLSELKTRSLDTLPGPAQVKGHSLQVCSECSSPELLPKGVGGGGGMC